MGISPVLIIKKLQNSCSSIRWENPGAMAGAGVPAKGFGKKRGRKEDLRSRKEAAHGFRNLSAIKIPVHFEQPITELKTKFDKNMNSVECGVWSVECGVWSVECGVWSDGIAFGDESK